MPETRNLCAKLPVDLYQRVCEAREQSGLTTAQYITNLLLDYYEMKESGGKTIMASNTRTMAFQIPEDLFLRIKAHLERETARTGRKLTQREFVLGLVEAALDEAERQAGMTTSPEPEETGVSPCESREDSDENSNLPSDAPIDDGSGVAASDYGASEGEESSNDGDMGHEGGTGYDETPPAPVEGDADGGED